LSETRDMGDFSKKEKFKWMWLPYLGVPTEKLSSELRKYGYHVGFYPLTTLNNLIRLEDPESIENKSSIYRIKRGDCDSALGKLGENLKLGFVSITLPFSPLMKKDRLLLYTALKINMIMINLWYKAYNSSTIVIKGDQ